MYDRCCLSAVLCYSLSVGCCLMCVVRCWLFNVCCVLLIIVRCSLLVVCCLAFDGCCLLFVGR